MNTLIPLPIDKLIPEILEALPHHSNFIIQASPGSGKTTRIPPALLQSGFCKPGEQIWVLVPRRLAAKMAANRIAEEWNEKPGETIGYQFRFEKVSSSKTRILFLTEGMFLRLLQNNPELKSVAAIFLDEFHERHLHTDVALAYLKYLQQNKRPDLKIFIMSATLNSEPLKKFLSHSKEFNLELTRFPLQIEYQAFTQDIKLEEKVSRSVREILRKNSVGDILVFLPGMASILYAAQRLEKEHPSLEILPLHGDLSTEEQHKIFQNISKRKVILSTNIAESSLTIPGVRIVIDSGLHRQARYSWWSGIPSLITRTISQDSAIQRAGRAARQSEGFCIRLFSLSDYEGRPKHEIPEIQRADLTQTLLELKNLLPQWNDIEWLEAPSNTSLEHARDTLFQISALSENDLSAKLTPLGIEIAKLPLHPRLSRLLIEGKKYNILPLTAKLAALISEGELGHIDSRESLLNNNPSRNVQKATEQILRSFGSNAQLQKPSQNDFDKLSLCLLKAFPDRVAKNKITKGNAFVEILFCQGGVGRASSSSLFQTESYYIVLDVQETQNIGQSQSKLQVRSLFPITEEQLLESEHMIHEKNEITWDKKSERLIQKQSLLYGILILSESSNTAKASVKATQVFLKEALGIDLNKKNFKMDCAQFLEACGGFIDREKVEYNLMRLRLYLQETQQINLDPEMLHWIPRFFEGVISRSDLKTLPLEERILQNLGNDFIFIQQLLPEFILLKGKKKIKVHYPFQQDPYISSRLQDFYGIQEVPKLLNGKLSLRVHLLAPNQRPIQVTQDLRSFWSKTYPEMKAQLSRRYPKQPWP